MRSQGRTGLGHWLVGALLLAMPRYAQSVTVLFELEAPDAQTVSVAGEFNDWDIAALPLQRRPDGIWSCAAELTPGEYAYKFVVDGQWIMDPRNPKIKTVDGAENSLLMAGGETAPSPTAAPFNEAGQPPRSRIWTSRSGAQLEATFLEEQAGTVILIREGERKLKIKFAAMSEADQRYVEARRAPAGPEPESTTEAAPGSVPAPGPTVVEEYPLRQRMFASARAYFEGSAAENARRYYANCQILNENYRPAAYDPEAPLEYAGDQQKASLFMPVGYDASTNWGLLIFLDPGNRLTVPETWKPVLAKHRLLWACPAGAQDGQPDMRRVGLALDTLATLRADHVFNTHRVYLAGVSGGGRIAAQTALLYPDYFVGAIIQAARAKLRTPQDRDTTFPFLQDVDVQKIARRDLRWAFFTGDKDPNYLSILGLAQGWANFKFRFRIFDVPGQNADTMTGEWLDQVVQWLEGAPVEGATPRFRENKVPFSGKPAY